MEELLLDSFRLAVSTFTGRDELRNVVHVALREQVRGTGLESAVG